MNKDNQQYNASTPTDILYHTKATLSKAFIDIFEDLLRNAYDNDEPLATLPVKCTTGVQTGATQEAVKTKKQIDVKKLISRPWNCQNRSYSVDECYHSKRELSEACVDLFENILKEVHSLDEPLTRVPEKFSTLSQTLTISEQEVTKVDEPVDISNKEHNLSTFRSQFSLKKVLLFFTAVLVIQIANTYFGFH